MKNMLHLVVVYEVLINLEVVIYGAKEHMVTRGYLTILSVDISRDPAKES